MLGSTFIETAIGLSLIFLLMSLMCSVLCEALARWLKWREMLLYSSIAELVRDATLRNDIYKHELIQSLGTASVLDLYTDKGPWYLPEKWVSALKEGNRPAPMPGLLFKWLEMGQRPSYIPSDIFARVLVALVLGDKAATDSATVSEVRTALGQPGNEKLKKALQALLQDPKIVEVEEAYVVIARWFDSAMMPVTERFKRRSQTVVFMLAIPLTLALNVDTLLVANRLQRDESLREAVVASATSFASEYKEPGATAPAVSPANDAQSRLLALEVELEQLDLPIGWPTEVEVKAAEVKASAAAQVLADAREDAEVPAAVWKKAREDLRSRHGALTKDPGAPAKKAEYGEAKTDALTARSEDERARAAVALALLSSEHLSLNEQEIRSRTLAYLRPSSRATAYKLLLRVAGWLFTVLAVSLGTRFWFDTLDKLVSIRSGVKPKEEDKKDR